MDQNRSRSPDRSPDFFPGQPPSESPPPSPLLLDRLKKTPKEQKPSPRQRLYPPLNPPPAPVKPTLELLYPFASDCLLKPCLPEVVILGVHTHGENVADLRKTIDIPKGMTLNMITSSSPGTCNFAFRNIDYVMKELIDDHIYGKPIDQEHITLAIKSLKKSQSYINRGFKNVTDPQLKTDIKNYIHQSDSLYRQINYNSSSKFKPIDKYFIQRIGEKPTTPEFDLKIKILNMPGFPDLFKEPHFPVSHGDGTNETSLNNIIQYLNYRGVKDVIIFDFSCSVYNDDLTDKETRILRRDQKKIEQEIKNESEQKLKENKKRQSDSDTESSNKRTKRGGSRMKQVSKKRNSTLKKRK